ncbi:hypothetical protein HPG69_004501 [Diceros bicornis minor]|uniref:non-specific serine/threonine protein kinase n=1 Tax=Diceros bicornis minor TaxID=77932 RepID=A0A7J7F9D6_DICBM|nr:hypothetical protein HPG69_004501 [Diceros bicornis minor]
MLLGLAATSANQKTHINNYELLKTTGEGIFSQVKLARHIPAGTEVAVKVIQKNRQSFSRMKDLFHEVHSPKPLNHLNIVKLFEVIDTEETIPCHGAH